MANAFVTPDAIARQALASLYETTVMFPLVYRDLTADFRASKIGDTINVRKPAVFEARAFDRATGITLQDATETKVPVVLDQFYSVDFAVTSEDFALELNDLDEQLITPAMIALAQQIDVSILSLRDDVTQVVGDGTSTHTWDEPEVLIDAGAVLSKAKVPTTGRIAVIGVDTNAAWLATDTLKPANTSGSTEALREARIGARLFGFDPYWTQNVTPAADTPAAGEPTTEVGVAFHESAFAFASAPLTVPPGANGSVRSYRGLSLRVTWAYDQKYKETIFSVDALWGVKALDPNRAVLIKGPDQV